jgi:anti-repressor protein
MKNALLLADNRIHELENKIIEDKPITDFWRAISQSVWTVKIWDWVKAITENWDLKIWRNKAFQWFRKNKYITMDNKPMQQYINQWLFELKEGMVVTDTKTIQTFTTLLTGKWQMYFAKKLKEEYL